MKIAAMCFLFCEGKILLMQRKKLPNIGKWVPPGGKLKLNELPIEACFREIYEETGFHLTNPVLLGILTEVSPVDYNWITYIYTQEVDFFDPIETAEGKAVWHSISEIHNLSLPDIDYLFLEYLFSKKRFLLFGRYDENLTLLNHRFE